MLSYNKISDVWHHIIVIRRLLSYNFYQTSEFICYVIWLLSNVWCLISFSPELGTFVFDNCKDGNWVWERSKYYWKQEDQEENAVTPSLCFTQVSLDRCSKDAWSDSKWPEKIQMRVIKLPSVLWIPFILISGSPNECRLHTCDACIIITWRWKLRATHVARNKSG